MDSKHRQLVNNIKQVTRKQISMNSLGAICVLPASIVICVGKLSDFALSCMRKNKMLHSEDKNSLMIEFLSSSEYKLWR